ncbi:hypothetical protein ADK38_22405, partial [Streptomyces varsoviensis]
MTSTGRDERTHVPPPRGPRDDGPALLAEVLPAAAETAETFEDPADARLFPEEEALIAKAVDKRRREFTTARHCARQALARLGLPPAPLVHRERGAPT